jgi:hypothetical protein
MGLHPGYRSRSPILTRFLPACVFSVFPAETPVPPRPLDGARAERSMRVGFDAPSRSRSRSRIRPTRDRIPAADPHRERTGVPFSTDNPIQRSPSQARWRTDSSAKIFLETSTLLAEHLQVRRSPSGIRWQPLRQRRCTAQPRVASGAPWEGRFATVSRFPSPPAHPNGVSPVRRDGSPGEGRDGPVVEPLWGSGDGGCSRRRVRLRRPWAGLGNAVSVENAVGPRW